MPKFFTEYYFQIFNESINPGTFPDIIKLADITPVFKKGYRGSKDSYLNGPLVENKELK